MGTLKYPAHERLLSLRDRRDCAEGGKPLQPMDDEERLADALEEAAIDSIDELMDEYEEMRAVLALSRASGGADRG